MVGIYLAYMCICRRLTHDGTPQRAQSEKQLTPTSGDPVAFDRDHVILNHDINLLKKEKDAYEPDESDLEYKPPAEEKRKKPLRRRKKREGVENSAKKMEVEDSEREDQLWTNDLDNR